MLETGYEYHSVARNPCNMLPITCIFHASVRIYILGKAHDQASDAGAAGRFVLVIYTNDISSKYAEPDMLPIS